MFGARRKTVIAKGLKIEGASPPRAWSNSMDRLRANCTASRASSRAVALGQRGLISADQKAISPNLKAPVPPVSGLIFVRENPHA